MKTCKALFAAIVLVFSLNCFSQGHSQISDISGIGNTSKNDLVIVGYYVEETINMAFGKRITKYEVSKLDMVNTYDLGPNNTRVVTPIYRKPKTKIVDVALQSKTFVDSSVINIKPIKVEVIAPTETPKYLSIDVVDTYTKVLNKGYKSIEMLTKVADRAYFSGDLVTAAKYYEELFNMTADLESMYYYRYSQALKATNQENRAEEMMLLFESKNIGNNVIKHNKLVRN